MRFTPRVGSLAGSALEQESGDAAVRDLVEQAQVLSETVGKYFRLIEPLPWPVAMGSPILHDQQRDARNERTGKPVVPALVRLKIAAAIDVHDFDGAAAPLDWGSGFVPITVNNLRFGND